MEQFLGFAIPGIPFGCTYALFAVGLVLTYQATGVFNFAFGAQAFAAAFVYTWATQIHHFPVAAAFVLTVLVMSPALGLLFDHFLFSRIPAQRNMAKVVTGLSLFVGIPALLPVVFGNQNLLNSPSVFWNIDTVYFTVFGTPINGAELTVMVVTGVALAGLVVMMRLTPLGLQMRGAVESRRLVQLDGVNARAVVAIAWVVSSILAGLSGVLLAPLFAQVQAIGFTTLMVAAVAAAAWAALRSLPVAAAVAILVGVLESVFQGYLPTSSWLYSAVLPAFPFIVLAVALLVVPGLRTLETDRDPLASVDPPPPPPLRTIRLPVMDRIIRVTWYAMLAAFIVSMLTWMPRTWENVFNSGLAFSTIFLSVTLITGMAGQLSLAQGTLAGVGAFAAAQVAHHLGLNMLLGGLIGALAAAAVAVVLALLSLRLAGLGLALMTLAGALFFDNAVFNQSGVSNGAQGLSISQDWVAPFHFFDPNGHQLFVLAMVALVLCVIVVNLVRKGTTGRFLAAMRGSETGAAGIGIDLSRQRITVFALAGVIAGIGGTVFTIQQQVANAEQWNYELSVAFVVIVVTTGVSTVEGAIQGGMGFVVTQQLLTYLPGRFGGSSLVFVGFAFGALTYAAHPEGVLEYQKARATLKWQKRIFERRGPPMAPPTERVPVLADG
ncbi:MAG TPA: ABC transporter permease [Acidimicrobiales bacterium]|nr:ABC transporter permease [Acidimicrobiales bacterium]